MKLGVAYPTTEAAGNPDSIRRFIRAAEELGFEFINHPDHVVKATHEGRTPKLNGPYTEHDSFDDPFVFFGFAAALSDKLEFVTGVLVLPQRQTALVAQQAADVDLLSKERFRLGVGIGWNYVEFDALGQDFRTRVQRLEEQIGFLRQSYLMERDAGRARQKSLKPLKQIRDHHEIHHQTCVQRLRFCSRRARPCHRCRLRCRRRRLR